MSAYWKAHFSNRHSSRSAEGVAKSLDYSNSRVQLQTYAAVLEGVGELNNRAVWDVGCGWGRLALLFHAAGADVTGTDLVPETIETLQREHPEIRWKAMDIMDDSAAASMPRFDLVVACEILQHVTHEVVRTLWDHVSAGGRLIGCVSNSDCPIVASVVKRYVGTYLPMSVGELLSLSACLQDVDGLWLKGLTFREDQRFLPYSASDWCSQVSGTPNRLVFALTRTPRFHRG